MQGRERPSNAFHSNSQPTKCFSLVQKTITQILYHFLFDPLIFSHVGEDSEAEMDDRGMTLYCPLSIWVAAHPAEMKEHQGL